jgi:hypothetical protein
MSSSYQFTCQDITIDGNVLSTVCQSMDGSWDATSLVLMGIENIDGVLTVTDPSQEASFHLSSQNISVNGDVLSAECCKIDGECLPVEITLNGIENIDGVLTYTGEP